MKEGPEMCTVLQATWKETLKSSTNEMQPAFFSGAGTSQRPKPLSGGGGAEEDDDRGGNYPIPSPLAGYVTMHASKGH
jgi:hypothetical protein